MTFSEFSIYLQKIESTASRNEITEILSQLFHAARAEEIGKMCYLLQGRVAPLYEATEFGVADKFIIRAIAQANGVEVEKVTAEFKKLGDVGLAAEKLHRGSSDKLSVVSVYETLLAVAHEEGMGSQEKKIALLADLLTHLDSLSARFVMRIPLDKLRLGFSEMTILDSLSWMLAGDKSLRAKLEDAYNVRPDIAYIAQTVKKDGMNGLSHVRAHVGSPVLAELCQRLPNADEMIKKMGTVAVEPKYDGVRVQIHFKKNSGSQPEVKTYSRNLENTTEMFAELTFVGPEIHAHDVILDCEAVGLDAKTGKLVSFQETTTRKRKHGIEAATASVPLRFFVFDILYKDGHDLLDVPLSERRKILETVVHPKKLLSLSPQIITSDAATLRRYHDEQITKGLEGVVIKKWNSPYEPGRRGYSWVKFKEEEGKAGKLTDTIDAVVMGYYVGEGKRTGFGIGAFLVGVRDGDRFVTVTKIGTGVSDELWKALKESFGHEASKMKPKEYGEVQKIFEPDVWVNPKIVVEIAGDDLTVSATHGAGVAVRFPRLVRIRNDKSAGQVTTVSELTQMFRNQKNHSKQK